MPAPENIVLLALIGDALALGPHWIYNQVEIVEKIDNLTAYHDPISSYHPGKSAGDFTHYGDQAMILLRSLAKRRQFDLHAFAADWKAFWSDPSTRSYRDGATEGTLAHLAGGGSPEAPGSDSNDIAAAGRIAPLFLLPWESNRALIAAAEAQAQFTHGSPETVEAAAFFARVVLLVQRGQSIPDAVRATADREEWEALSSGWFDAAEQSSRSDASDLHAAKTYGLSCHTPDAFPVILHLLLRYPTDPAKALVANAAAGGDSAARGLILGMVYGARSEMEGIPASWLEGLSARAEIEALSKEVKRHD